jgi:hypothetical protein
MRGEAQSPKPNAITTTPWFFINGITGNRGIESDSGLINLHAGGWDTGSPTCKFIMLDSASLGLAVALVS